MFVCVCKRGKGRKDVRMERQTHECTTGYGCEWVCKMGFMYGKDQNVLMGVQLSKRYVRMWGKWYIKGIGQCTKVVKFVKEEMLVQV